MSGTVATRSSKQSARPRQIAVLPAAFYLGGAFQRRVPALSWAVGRADRAEEGQPVVTGFSSDADLPVLAVVENLVLEDDRDPSPIATAIGSWRRFA